jgi:hypothetical protein
MTTLTYGKLPTIISEHHIKCDESMFYLYLPIKMANCTFRPFHVPDRLRKFQPLIWDVIEHSGNIHDKFIYISAKHMMIMPEFWGNRPGYHADGFLTNDLNYVWYDTNPTIFNTSTFNITPDHVISIREFEEQAKPENETTFPCYNLLKLDQFVVHKVKPVTKTEMRTFVKISVSEHQYNLKGNTHNYLMDYSWAMYDRAEVRNNPIYEKIKDADFVTDNYS